LRMRSSSSGHQQTYDRCCYDNHFFHLLHVYFFKGAMNQPRLLHVFIDF
jgi:hypothetical protein